MSGLVETIELPLVLPHVGAGEEEGDRGRGAGHREARVLEVSQIREILGRLSNSLHESDAMMNKTMVGPFDSLSFADSRALPFSGQLFHSNGSLSCLGHPLAGVLEVRGVYGRTFNAMRVFSIVIAVARVLRFGVVIQGHFGHQAWNPLQAMLGDSEALARSNVCMWPHTDREQAIATLYGDGVVESVQNATSSQIDVLLGRLRETAKSPQARNELLATTLAETPKKLVWTIDAKKVFFLGLSSERLLRPSDALPVHVEMPSLVREIRAVTGVLGNGFVGIHSRSHLARKSLSGAAVWTTPATPVFVACALAVHRVPLVSLFLASDQVNPSLDDALRHLAHLLKIPLYSYSRSSGKRGEREFEKIWNVLMDAAILQRAAWMFGSPLSSVDEYIGLRRNGSHMVLVTDTEEKAEELSACILDHKDLDATNTSALRLTR
jgi:hypothetical protein